MIMNNSPEFKEATQRLMSHCQRCEQCASSFDDDREEGLCEVGQKLYEDESAAMRRTSASISLIKQEDGGWIASFSDGREGGGFGHTAHEALCNLSDIIEKCLERKED